MNDAFFRPPSLLLCCIAIAIACTSRRKEHSKNPAPPPVLPAQAELRTPTDAEIAAAVTHEILRDSETYFELKVQSKNGVVTLSGVAPSFASSMRAERIAAAVVGVREIQNNISIVTTASEQDIQSRADSILKEHAVLKDENIEVRASGTHLTVRGSVDNFYEFQLARILAESIRGINRLNFELEYIPVEAPTDRQLELQITDLLLWDTRVNSTSFTVTTYGSKALLKGTMHSLAQKRTAMDDAYAAGAKAVDATRLDVFPGSPATKALSGRSRDDLITVALDTWLLHFLDDDEYESVDFDLKEGVVTLYGATRSLGMSQVLEHEVRRIEGVKGVKNKLSVKKVAAPQLSESHAAFLLTNHPFLADRVMSVKISKGGTTTVSGSVGSHFERAVALNTLSLLEGVNSIKDKLEITNSVTESYAWTSYRDSWYFAPPKQKTARSNLTDDVITSNLRKELIWNPFVDLTNVRYSVERGIATLSGTVDNWNEKNAAIDEAFQAGAKTVNDELTIR